MEYEIKSIGFQEKKYDQTEFLGNFSITGNFKIIHIFWMPSKYSSYLLLSKTLNRLNYIRG